MVSHFVKSVRIRSFSGPHFPAFGLNTGRSSVFLCIQSEYWKIWTRKTPNTDTFHAVLHFHKNYQKTLTLYKSLTTSFWENQKEGKTLAKSSKSKSGYWTYRIMFVLVKWNINTWGTYYQSSPYLPTSLCYEYFAIPNFMFPQNVCSKSVDVYKHLKFPYEYFHKEGCYKLKVISYFNVN